VIQNVSHVQAGLAPIETVIGGEASFAELAATIRALQDAAAAAAPPLPAIAEATAALAEVTALLRTYAVPERDQISGRLITIPGRGQTLVPVVQPVPAGPDRMRGLVRFGGAYLGVGGAVHGGAIPLLFDDLLGRLSDGRRPGVVRTAYLHVDYRRATPIERDLQVEAWFEHEEGRKRFLRGTLHDGDQLCAEAHGLFVELQSAPGLPGCQVAPAE
jgi:acyl-coenzyme A thioesterase PaaI-like protein